MDICANPEFDHLPIMDMPLHQITGSMGTAGLRDRFAREVIAADFDQPSTEAIANAHDLAYELHEKDRRTNEPYENHLLRVAIRGLSSDHLGVKNSDLAIGALLHDSIEDHHRELSGMGPGTRAEISRLRALGKLALKIGGSPALIVEEVTNPIVRRGQDKQEVYLAHIERLIHRGDPLSILVKISDFIDNGAGILWSGPASEERYMHWATKYRETLTILEGALDHRSLPVESSSMDYIRKSFGSAEERFATILA